MMLGFVEDIGDTWFISYNLFCKFCILNI